MTSAGLPTSNGVASQNGPSIFAGGYLQVTGAQGNPSESIIPKVGTGVELLYIRDTPGAQDGFGILQAYSRETNSWRDLRINAKNVILSGQDGGSVQLSDPRFNGTASFYKNPPAPVYNGMQIQLLSDSPYLTGIGFHEQGSSATTLYKPQGDQHNLRIHGNDGADYALAGMDVNNIGSFQASGHITASGWVYATGKHFWFSTDAWMRQGTAGQSRIDTSVGIQAPDFYSPGAFSTDQGFRGGYLKAGATAAYGAEGRIFLHSNETVYTTLNYPWLDFTNCRLRSPTMGLTGAADKFVMGGAQAELGTSTLTWQCITATPKLSVADNDPHGITFYVNGQAGGTTGWATGPSTRREKINIQPLDNALGMVKNDKLHGTSYLVRSPKRLEARGREVQPDPEPKLGFIVDDWEQLAPSVCVYDGIGQLFGMDYSQVTPIIWEALKQYIAQTDARLAALER